MMRVSEFHTPEKEPQSTGGNSRPAVASNTMESPAARGSLRRYYRLKTVIDVVAAQPVFALSDTKSVLKVTADEQPAFVTRLVRELEKSGWVVREETNPDMFRWNSSRGKFCSERWLDEKVYGSQVKVAPAQQRPRERLLAHGAAALSEAELIAILVRSGLPGESALTAGKKISDRFASRLEQLPDAGRAELAAVSRAIQSTAYCQIMAGIELGRRVAAQSRAPKPARISSTDEAIRFCSSNFARLADESRQEEFHIVTLDTKNQVINTHQITVGTLDASLVHPREVFRAAIRDAASSVILCHNHPSGDPAPSREDFAVTRRLEQCGETLGIRVLDHIVVASQGTASIRESGG